MNKRILPFILIAIIAVGLFSCNRKKDTTVNISNVYFPLEFGRYITYDVDSVIWSSFDCNNNVRTSKCQMRYTVADTFRDDQDRLSYRIEVMKRLRDTMSWEPFKVMYATITPASVEVVESNFRFIKQVLPVKNGITWKGNTYISGGDADNLGFTDWNYLYSNVGEPYANGRANFDNTVVVDQVNDGINYDPADSSSASYGDRTYAVEVYGYNIGMVFREVTRWVRQPGSCRDGFSVTMRAIDYN
ncbi:MAG: hypothetical protein JNL72_06565 [Flavipsychrobacter sp.]|nr:hypothetical protein [Flavipsychrobacter sp.]